MKYFKMLIIIALMVTGLISEDEQIDRICLIGLTAFALSSVIGKVLDVVDDDCDCD